MGKKKQQSSEGFVVGGPAIAIVAWEEGPDVGMLRIVAVRDDERPPDGLRLHLEMRCQPDAMGGERWRTITPGGATAGEMVLNDATRLCNKIIEKLMIGLCRQSGKWSG